MSAGNRAARAAILAELRAMHDTLRRIEAALKPTQIIVQPTPPPMPNYPTDEYLLPKIWCGGSIKADDGTYTTINAAPSGLS